MIIFVAICGNLFVTLESNLGKRASVYDEVMKIFSFLADLTLSKVELQRGVELLMQEYPEDVNQNLTEELFHLSIYVRQTHKPSKNSPLSHTDLYQIIFKENIQVAFPNVESILRLFLSLIVTNCTGERTFSRLKNIKNQLRSTMTRTRLSSLSILCVENETFRKIDFDELIEEFCVKKFRKKFF
ncbi:zinc finger MYM-type protein 1 [Caerostris extrusa]|uniref:Zinc finger MYM-type protein 1 n=1 Tax=Caerostris extrusa TaxID=172846 RepID=A0AAV4VS16_CAEEX|nr:zinc finger MYM-type protein 1 [Caerostris extrusa]